MTRFAAVCSIVALALAPQAKPVIEVGTRAPAFSAPDDRGRTHSLSEYRGKFVVLEWHEKGCPYVAKHYRSGEMQRRQAAWMKKGVAWLLVNSSAPGFHSYLTPDESRAYRSELKTTPTAMLLDAAGTIGKSYRVSTALHMVIIDPKGVVIYNGAIDDQPKTEASSLAGASNFVDAALTEALAGKPIATATSTPYGCEVHYAK